MRSRYEPLAFHLYFLIKLPRAELSLIFFSSDYGNVFRLFGGPLAEFLAIIFDLACMIALVTWANPLYLTIVATVILFNYIVYRRNRETLRKNRRELSALRSPSISHFAETAQGALHHPFLQQGREFRESFFASRWRLSQQKLLMTSKIIVYSFKMNSLTAVLLLATGIAAYFWLQQGWITVGSLGVAFGFITLSGTTVQMFFEWMAQFEEALVGMERLDQYLHRPIEPGALLPASSQFQTAHPKRSFSQQSPSPLRLPQARVSIKNLSFRYRDDLPFVLKGLNLEIKAGERLGVVGRTGERKIKPDPRPSSICTQSLRGKFESRALNPESMRIPDSNLT